MASLNPAKGNPNAATSLASTIGGGQAIVNIAQAFGWHVSTGWGITIAGAASYVVLFVGREGLAGVWHGLMHGFAKTPDT